MSDQSTLLDQARRLLAAGRPGLALAPSQAHLSAHPDDVEGLHVAAQIYLLMGRLDDAERQFQRATSLAADSQSKPEFAATRDGIEAARLTRHAESLQHDGRFSEAQRDLQRAAELVPDRPWPINNLAHLSMTIGRLDDAIRLFRTAADHPHGHVQRAAHSNLLLAMMHSDRFTPAEQLAEHRRWADRFAQAPTSFTPATIDDRDPERVIRVGYVSPDFRNHPVASFIEPVLAHHDRNRFEITCYSDVAAPDVVTDRLRAIGHRWVDCTALPFEKMFAQVRADRIDILIDLAVHSGQNRQPLFAARPAPIQMTWLGYAGSTGSAAIDYRITDATVDPPGLTEPNFTEQLLRLPDAFWCYAPPPNAPAIPPNTPSTDRPLRVGTATRLAKITPSCMDLWSKLLARLPNSTLELASDPFADESIAKEWLDNFESRGIERSRIRLRAAMNFRDYLAFLSSLDIGLDTFPFNGGTTACHTLWMGTPVVALAGPSSVSRVTASIVRAVGRDWVAFSGEEWVNINARLAMNEAERIEARSKLRDWMKQSPLCDAPRFVRGLEDAFRRVFRERCR